MVLPAAAKPACVAAIFACALMTLIPDGAVVLGGGVGLGGGAGDV
jgi:hypothetical protein